MSDEHETGAGPLAGYRVVELGVWVAGPAAAGLLCDWGAEVVKVEPPSGDPQRDIFGALGLKVAAAPPFELDNRGKKSVVLDLRRPDGLDAMERLLDTADVFVTNLRPDALERLGLDHRAVQARHPRLVYASLTGYGLDGPDRNRPGYDVGAFWARSGLAATIVPPGQLPPGIRSGMGDHVTGLTLCAGVLAKLLERERTGRGGLVATSLLRAGMYCQGWDLGIVLRFGRIQRTRPRTANPAPLVNCYAAGDGKGFWLLGLEQDRHWPGLVSAIERPELRDDPRFASAAQRGEHAEGLVTLLDEVFATRTRDEWTEAFDLHDVWWAPINSLHDVLADPQAEAAGGFVDMPLVAGVEPYRAVASPVDFAGYVQRPGPVPTLGQHTDEVLASLLP